MLSSGYCARASSIPFPQVCFRRLRGVTTRRVALTNRLRLSRACSRRCRSFHTAWLHNRGHCGTQAMSMMRSKPPRKLWIFLVAARSTSQLSVRHTQPPEDEQDARAALDRLAQLSVHGYVSPYQLSLIHLHLGERERALELLQDAYAIRDAWVVWLGVEPQFDPLRGDPIFEGILRDMRHPAIYRKVGEEDGGSQGEAKKVRIAYRADNHSDFDAGA